MARADDQSLASGFSHTTCLPWASASMAISAWSALGTQMSTRSTSSAWVIARQSTSARLHPHAWASAPARSRSTSATAVSATSRGASRYVPATVR